MAKNKRKIIRDMLFEVYDKGVQNEECNLDFYYEKMMQALNIPCVIKSDCECNLDFYYEKMMQALNIPCVIKSVCDCGKPIDSRYDPCCSLKCWVKKFL